MDDISAVENQTAGIREAPEDTAQGLTIATTDSHDEPGCREIIGLCDSAMPVFWEVGHEHVEETRLIRVQSQILEAAHSPSRLMRIFSTQRGIEHSPSIPGAGHGPEARSMVKAVRR